MRAPEGEGARAALIERLVVELGAAFQQRSVYPAAHPQVQRAIARTIAAFEAWCVASAGREASLIVLEGQLLIDRQLLPDSTTWTRGLLLALSRHSLGGVTLLLGLEAGELAAFLDACAEGTRPEPSRHLQFGQAGFVGEARAEGALGEPGTGATTPALAPPDQLAAARAELTAIARGAASRLDALRETMIRLARAAGGARLAPPRLTIADVDDVAFLHGLSVALATLAIGHALGLEGERLEELGLAGLLHDIGYLEPASGESADERRRRHTARGAARLAAVEGLSELPIVAAYEHHLRFDGAANYPRLGAPRTPVAAARIVAVADTWDTVRTRGRASPEEALVVLRDRSGSFLDPTLVELFAGLVAATPG